MNIQITKTTTLSRPKTIVLMIIIMIATFCGGIMFMKHDSKLKKECTYQVTATVTDIKESSSSDSDTYTPVYTFEYEGKEYTVSSNVYSSNLKVQRGEDVQIYINPSNPNTFYSPKDASGKVFEIVLFIISGVCLLIAALNIKAVICEKKDNLGY
ncbi:MAG: DUF3592 domain-containing protein [Ruminococcus sp.]|uniref:DUF3592 domain-containing protein n=1 Tax=Ruminococcus sp. TaxID=41978 RepID=UPI0025F3489B|nr:DUF3592 domain-containing protein [Ruminococcus sp.]MCR5600060.1 DUF3592 domain-containing protein [Ruminococcus sp.]